MSARDSKAPNGPASTFAAASWAAFIVELTVRHRMRVDRSVTSTDMMSGAGPASGRRVPRASTTTWCFDAPARTQRTVVTTEPYTTSGDTARPGPGPVRTSGLSGPSHARVRWSTALPPRTWRKEPTTH
ncbi:DUF397 domain-containing protein, partial [Streptomyces acidicola]|uniref:DUF397 domain-containing protein n=1 Tax=Streptomyces acidicola TaxID=2596892 RepID=UPI002AD39B6F